MLAGDEHQPTGTHHGETDEQHEQDLAAWVEPLSPSNTAAGGADGGGEVRQGLAADKVLAQNGGAEQAAEEPGDGDRDRQDAEHGQRGQRIGAA